MGGVNKVGALISTESPRLSTPLASQTATGGGRSEGQIDKQQGETLLTYATRAEVLLEVLRGDRVPGAQAGRVSPLEHIRQLQSEYNASAQ